MKAVKTALVAGLLVSGCAMKERPVPLDAATAAKIELASRSLNRANGDKQPYIIGMMVSNSSDREITSLTVEFQALKQDKIVFRKDVTWDKFTDFSTGYAGSLLPNSSAKVSQSLKQHDLPDHDAYWMVVKSVQGYKKGDNMSDLGHFFAAITRKDNTAVQAALKKNGSLATAKDPFSQVSSVDQTCICDNVDALQMFLDRGAPMDYTLLSGNTPLYVAFLNNSYRVAKLLLEQGADVKQVHNGLNALQMAVPQAPAEIIAMLIKRGVPVNSDDEYWNSPLAIAAQRGDEKIVKMLLDAHADPNKMDRYYGGPLHRAAYSKSPEVTRMLLAAGADPNAITAPKRPYTPLMWAACYGDPETVRLLLKAGGDPNRRDNQGMTPLDYAVRYGNEETAKVLSEVK